MLKWKFFLTTSVAHEDFVKRYRDLLSNITINGFGDARRSLADAKGNSKLYKFLNRSDAGSLLEDEKGEIYGFAFATIPAEKLFEKRLVWIDNVCLDKRVQGKGYGIKRLLRAVQRIRFGEGFGWAGCQTQHCGLMNSLYAASSGDIFPFAQSYDSEKGKQALSFLTANVEQVRESGIERAGLCRKVFDDGRLGNDDSRARPEIEAYLALNKFSRDYGDSVIILAQI